MKNKPQVRLPSRHKERKDAPKKTLFLADEPSQRVQVLVVPPAAPIEQFVRDENPYFQSPEAKHARSSSSSSRLKPEPQEELKQYERKIAQFLSAKEGFAQSSQFVPLQSDLKKPNKSKSQLEFHSPQYDQTAKKNNAPNSRILNTQTKNQSKSPEYNHLYQCPACSKKLEERERQTRQPQELARSKSPPQDTSEKRQQPNRSRSPPIDASEKVAQASSQQEQIRRMNTEMNKLKQSIRELLEHIALSFEEIQEDQGRYIQNQHNILDAIFKTSNPREQGIRKQAQLELSNQMIAINVKFSYSIQQFEDIIQLLQPDSNSNENQKQKQPKQANDSDHQSKLRQYELNYQDAQNDLLNERQKNLFLQEQIDMLNRKEHELLDQVQELKSRDQSIENLKQQEEETGQKEKVKERKQDEKWGQVYKLIRKKDVQKLSTFEMKQLTDQIDVLQKQVDKMKRELTTQERQMKNYISQLEKSDKDKKNLNEIIQEQRLFAKQLQSELEGHKRKHRSSTADQRRQTDMSRSKQQTTESNEMLVDQEDQVVQFGVIALKNEIERLTVEEANFSKIVQEQHKYIEQLEEDVSLLKQQSSHQQLIDKINQQNSQLQLMNDELSKSQAQLSEERIKLSTLQNEKDAEIARLNTEIIRVKAKQQDPTTSQMMKAQQSAYEQQIADLQRQLKQRTSVAGQQQSSLQDQIENLGRQNKELITKDQERQQKMQQKEEGFQTAKLQLNEQIDQLSRKAKQSDEDIKARDAQIQELKAQVKKLEGQTQELKRASDQATSGQKEQEQMLQQKLKELNELNKHYTALSEENTKNQKTIQDLQKQLSLKDEQIKELKSASDLKDAQIQQQRSISDQATAEQHSNDGQVIHQLEQQNQQLNALIGQLNASLDEQKGNVKTLQKTIDELHAQQTVKQSEAVVHEEDFKQRIQALELKIKQLQEVGPSDPADVADLKRLNAEMIGDLQRETQTSERLGKQCENLQFELRVLKDELAKVREQPAQTHEVGSGDAGLQSKCNDLQAQLELHSANEKSLVDEIAKLKSDLQKNVHDQQDSSELHEARRQIEQLKQQLQSTPTKSKDSSDEEKDLKKELSLLKEHNKSLTAELAAAKSQGDDSKKKEISELKVLNDKMFDKQKLLNQQIKEQQSRIKELESKQPSGADQGSKVKELEEKIKQLELSSSQQNEALKQENTLLKQHQQTQNDDQSQHVRKETDLEKRNRDLEQQVEALLSQLRDKTQATNVGTTNQGDQWKEAQLMKRLKESEDQLKILQVKYDREVADFQKFRADVAEKEQH